MELTKEQLIALAQTISLEIPESDLENNGGGGSTPFRKKKDTAGGPRPDKIPGGRPPPLYPQKYYLKSLTIFFLSPPSRRPRRVSGRAPRHSTESTELK